VRALVTSAAWRVNAGLQKPMLDAWYFLEWAHDIATGDPLGRHGVVHGEPFLFNPLYAYVIAPIVGAFGEKPAPVIVFQVLLAGATAALAAAAARRFAGNVAAWTAGIAVAFSTPLVHLDEYVAVSGLAAFLVAGACFACAPKENEKERGHGPLAAGIWLGLSALARPVAMFALPFVAWMYARRETKRLRAAALVVLPVVLLAGLSLARNWSVAGERVVFTAANGQNLHLGNNPAARRLRTMTTNEFVFDPQSMHEDAQFRVGVELGREPTRGEISDYYARRAWRELIDKPGESLAWYFHKTRWFFSSLETGSTADYDFDVGLAPLLRLGFVPTWLLASMAVAGAAIGWKKRGLLAGPGALVLAHVAACTLSFPLSHYRSPAVPAMAVLAGVAVAAAVEGLRASNARPLATTIVVTGFVAALGALEPQPLYPRHVLLANRALGERYSGSARDEQGDPEAAARDYDAAERDLREALSIWPEFLGAKRVLVDVDRARRRPDLALVWAQELVEAQPWNPEYGVTLARIEHELGRGIEARDRLRSMRAQFPWSGLVALHVGILRCDMGDVAEGKEDLAFAESRGARPPKEWTPPK